MNKKQIVGIVIFILLILIIVGIKVFGNTNSNNPGIIPKNLTTVYVKKILFQIQILLK